MHTCCNVVNELEKLPATPFPLTHDTVSGKERMDHMLHDWGGTRTA
jgi:hypothetical protein